MSLPVPFKDFIPRAYWDDPLSDTLAAKADEHIEAWRKDVCDLLELIDPAAVPTDFLKELGYFLAADLLQTDSERQKREKIRTAILGHKNRGTWNNDAKPKIDLVAGGDAVIFQASVSDDWILGGDGVTIQSISYWAALGADGVDLDLGISLIGEGDEIEIAGNIYIDVDNAALTADEVQQIVDSLEDVVPAYMVIYLGYVVGSQFIVYAGGIMG